MANLLFVAEQRAVPPLKATIICMSGSEDTGNLGRGRLCCVEGIDGDDHGDEDHGGQDDCLLQCHD